MNNHKRVLFVLLIGIIISTFLLLGKFAYSFLGSDIGEDVWSDGEVTASGDTLVFSKGEALSISASTDNFNLTTGNLSSTTHPKAKLMANNKTNNATASYSTGINIKRNTYKYTTSDNKPELILTVQDEAGNNITSATGLTYVTNINGVSGFDITREFGTIAIVNNHTITTTSTTTHIWTYTLTFINYPTDQSLNENASIELDIIYQSEEIENNLGNFAEYIKFTYVDDNTLYLHDKKLANGAGDNSYRYAGPSESVNNFVCFGTDVEECPDDNLYRIIGVLDDKVKLIKYDYATKDQLGTDGDYYGSEVTLNASYYKGSMSSIPYYYWNNLNSINSKNDWTISRLNKTNLNANYLTNVDEIWTQKITNTTWNIGGMNWNNGSLSNAKIAYDYEVGKHKIEKMYNAKIGLMYLSEYYYSASPEHWTKPGYDGTSGGETRDYRTAINQNWMYMGINEWTITPQPFGEQTTTFSVHYKGSSDGNSVFGNNGIRPTFSLIPEVILKSGEGTKTSPWKLL